MITSEIVVIGGGQKVKFPRGEVIHCGTIQTAFALMRAEWIRIAESSTAGYAAPASTAGPRAPASTAGPRAPASTAGICSTAACLGFDGTARAGELGALVLTWWDEANKRQRIVVGYVGEDGIEAGVWYRVEAGKLVNA